MAQPMSLEDTIRWINAPPDKALRDFRRSLVYGALWGTSEKEQKRLKRKHRSIYPPSNNTERNKE